VPTTSTYSHLDGIIAWQACLDTPSSRAKNIAVRSSHLGLAHHPAVLWAVADRLALPADAWKPFMPPALLLGAFPAASPSTPATAGSLM
jgi:hypothetical protein